MSIVLKIAAVHQYVELAHEAQHRNDLFKQEIKSNLRLYENENSIFSEVDSQLQRRRFVNEKAYAQHSIETPSARMRAEEISDSANFQQADCAASPVPDINVAVRTALRMVDFRNQCEIRRSP